jgi:hypothetical protein
MKRDTMGRDTMKRIGQRLGASAFYYELSKGPKQVAKMATHCRVTTHRVTLYRVTPYRVTLSA